MLTTRALRDTNHAVAALVLCAFSAGCSSAYMPRPGRQISVVMDSGHLAYVRDGRKYEGGLFGGDIDEAVQGNPQAEEYASEYRTGMITGFALTMLGVAGLLGGLVATDAELAAQPANNQTTPPVPGLVTLAAGAIAYGAGLILLFNAQPHLFDAINVYNDGVAAPNASPAPQAPAR
jgi:hypothetical protein